jgi:hypothetical protein
MNMPDPLPTTFREVAGEIMGQDAARCGDWCLREKNGEYELFIPKLSQKGFEITVVADQEEVTVYSEYLAHQHFTSDGDHQKASQLAMGLVRDLLSPVMRIRLVKIGGKPARGDLETLRDGKWRRESTTALFVLRLFRERTVEYYSNERLPARQVPD